MESMDPSRHAAGTLLRILALQSTTGPIRVNQVTGYGVANLGRVQSARG